MLDVAKILPVLIGVSGLLFGAFLAIRNRTIYKPNLVFSFRRPELSDGEFAADPKKKPLEAHFILNPPEQLAKDMRVPIHVKNAGRRKISDVVVEITYPLQYSVSNKQHSDLIERARTAFPDTLDDPDEFKKFLDMRQGSQLGDLYRVRYDVGILRPGDSMTFYELMKLPDRNVAFSDARYQNKLFAKILGLLSELHQVLGICRVEACVFSELGDPLRAQVNLVSVRGTWKDCQSTVLIPYGEAFWLNDFPVGRRYRRLWLKDWLKNKDVIKVATADLTLPKVVWRTASTDETTVVLGTGVDPFGGTHGMGELRLPGYDVFNLEHDITTVDEAFEKSGFRRVHVSV